MKTPSPAEQDRQFLRFLFSMLLLVCVLYVGLWFAVLSQWEPGEQEQVAREYRAQRHEAETVEVVTK